MVVFPELDVSANARTRGNQFIPLISLYCHWKENLAVGKLPGQRPGVANGDVAMPEGMGLGDCWRKNGAKQEGSS